MGTFGVSTVAKYQCSSVSMIHVSRTDSVATVGEIVSYFDIKSLSLFPPATILTFRVPSIFSLRKIWDYRIVFLCSWVN